jgi:hypothetical protein
MTSVRRFGAIVALLLAGWTVTPLFGVQSAIAEEPESAALYPLTDNDRLFLEFLKDAVTNDQRAWIADQVAYPIKVAIGGKRRTVTTKQEFITHYDEIINDRVRRSILTQRFEQLFSNWQGVMIDRGQVWFAGIFQSDGCEHSTGGTPDRSVFTCDFDRTYRLMIRAINNDFNPETGAHDRVE